MLGRVSLPVLIGFAKQFVALEFVNAFVLLVDPFVQTLFESVVSVFVPGLLHVQNKPSGGEYEQEVEVRGDMSTPRAFGFARRVFDHVEASLQEAQSALPAIASVSLRRWFGHT
ncbi:MAG: hypothetical protein KDB82_16025 [Planctomycetes bacterium]|nr:hypothetical protein [Planctomycetota bacterium]